MACRGVYYFILFVLFTGSVKIRIHSVLLNKEEREVFVMKSNGKYASIAVLYKKIPRNFTRQPSVQFSQNLLSSLLHSRDCSYCVRRRMLASPPLCNSAWIQKHVTVIVLMHIAFTSFSFERWFCTPVCPSSTNLFRQLTVIYFMLCARMNLLLMLAAA